MPTSFTFFPGFSRPDGSYLLGSRPLLVHLRGHRCLRGPAHPHQVLQDRVQPSRGGEGPGEESSDYRPENDSSLFLSLPSLQHNVLACLSLWSNVITKYIHDFYSTGLFLPVLFLAVHLSSGVGVGTGKNRCFS